MEKERLERRERGSRRRKVEENSLKVGGFSVLYSCDGDAVGDLPERVWNPQGLESRKAESGREESVKKSGVRVTNLQKLIL